MFSLFQLGLVVVILLINICTGRASMAILDVDWEGDDSSVCPLMIPARSSVLPLHVFLFLSSRVFFAFNSLLSFLLMCALQIGQRGA